MKRRFIVQLFAGLLWLAPGLSAEDDPVVKAMRDELSRSMKKLQLENLEKPYFISYQLYDTDSSYISASFGSLLMSDQHRRGRMASVQVRVGDYKFDNQNFFTYSYGSGVSRGYGNRATLPLDNNYDEVRRQLWLVTDSAYKKALEDLAKKRATLANKNRSDEIPDFSHESAVTISDERPVVSFNAAEMEKSVRDLSALFKQAPGVFTSSVVFRVTNEHIRYANSEGTFYSVRLPEVTVSVSASAQAVDGQPLATSFSYLARSLKDLPPFDKMAARIRESAGQMGTLRTAPLPDRYAGPVLFEGYAAAEIVYRDFLPHVLASPEVLVDNPQFRSMVQGDSDSLVEKIGLRVLPEFMSMADDPTISTFANSPLLGMFKVDSEGVPSRRMSLVENGVLTKLLTGRGPVLGIEKSSGSSHYGGVAPSNVILTASKSMPIDQLRAELMRRAKLRGKDYAIIVRRIDSPNRGAEVNTNSQSARALPVLLAYKRFADGHEEMVRNANINGITLASFKDILAVSDTPTVWHASYRPRTTNPFDPPGTTLMSLVTPDLLFEDATVMKPTGNFSKPPFIEHPYFSKK